MSQKIYVGNLSYQATEDTVRESFEEFGEITDLVIIKDRATGRSKGFGFITFDSAQSADRAVEEMNGRQLDGRAIKVSIAQEKQRTSSGSGERSRW